MKLLFLIKALGLPGGGAERVLADVTAGLVERGHAVTIASFDQPGTASFYHFHPAIERINLGVGNVKRRTGPFSLFARLRAIRSVLDEVDPAVAIGFMHSAYVPLRLATWSRKLPVIGSEHIGYGHYEQHPVDRWMVNLFAPRLRAITAISEPMRDSFPSSIKKRIFVVPNPVRAITAARVRTSRKNGGGMILTVGRLEPQKDQATLVSAFAKICRQHPDWRIRIVGDGSLRPALQAQIDALGVSDRITLAGSVSEIDAEYAAADLFALPSRYESFGLATAEALAHGLPVVGFADCPGTNELVVDGVNGLLVTGDNRVDSFAAALTEMIDSPEQRARMARAAPATVEAFNIENIVNQWEELLRAVTPTGRN